MGPSTVSYHEDDYCQIELLPIQNWGHCARELGRIEEFSEARAAPDGAGWTEMCIRSHAPLPLAALGIDFAGVCNILSLHLPQFDHVETGYGSSFEHCPNTTAFGHAGGCIIFVSQNDSGHVETIWLGIGPAAPQQETDFLASLHALDALGPLLLVDWAWNALLRLHDVEELRQYLHATKDATED